MVSHTSQSVRWTLAVAVASRIRAIMARCSSPTAAQYSTQASSSSVRPSLGTSTRLVVVGRLVLGEPHVAVDPERRRAGIGHQRDPALAETLVERHAER